MISTYWFLNVIGDEAVSCAQFLMSMGILTVCSERLRGDIAALFTVNRIVPVSSKELRSLIAMASYRFELVIVLLS